MANGSSPIGRPAQSAGSSGISGTILNGVLAGVLSWIESNPELLKDLVHRGIDAGANLFIDWLEKQGPQDTPGAAPGLPSGSTPLMPPPPSTQAGPPRTRPNTAGGQK